MIGDGKRARVAGYVRGEIDLRFFLVSGTLRARDVQIRTRDREMQDGIVVTKGARG